MPFRKKNRSTLIEQRELPEVSLAALLYDGYNVAVLAAAFDVPSKWIKETVDRVLVDLARQARMPILTFTRICPSWRRTRLSLDEVSLYCGSHWEGLLNPRETLEVVEARAYLRAFSNSRVVTAE